MSINISSFGPKDPRKWNHAKDGKSEHEMHVDAGESLASLAALRELTSGTTLAGSSSRPNEIFIIPG